MVVMVLVAMTAAVIPVVAEIPAATVNKAT
jgi:hypothetical protein